MEEPNELYLPWLNLCQSRPYGITSEWPVVPPGTRSVPLFSFLYHENLIGWAAFYPWKSAGRPWYSVAKGFTVGLMPGLVPPNGLGLRDEVSRQKFMALFERCMTGYRTFAHDYLVWGRMERPLRLDVPMRTLSRASQADILVPAVSHEVWSLDDGRVGVVFVNAQTEPCRLDVDLSPLVDDTNSFVIREISTQGGRREHPLRQIDLTIPPLDMLLIELDGRN